MRSDDILEGARSIRPYLSELLGPAGDDVDQKLADLLEQAGAGVSVDNLVLELLAGHGPTREWLAEFLADRRPPDVQSDVQRIYNPLPGQIEPVAAPKYVCPRGDYVWYRRFAGQPVPWCLTHGIGLILADP